MLRAHHGAAATTAAATVSATYADAAAAAAAELSGTGHSSRHRSLRIMSKVFHRIHRGKLCTGVDMIP